MKLSTTQPGETLSTLTRRLFPGASPAVLAEAQTKLAAANPHLASSTGAATGTPVVIPDVPDAVSTPAADQTGTIRALLTGARQQLGSVRDSLTTRLSRQTEDLKATVALAGSPEVVRLGDKFPDLKARLPAITQAANQRLSDLDKLNALQQKALAEVENDLDAFLGTGNPTAPNPTTAKPS